MPTAERPYTQDGFDLRLMTDEEWVQYEQLRKDIATHENPPESEA